MKQMTSLRIAQTFEQRSQPYLTGFDEEPVAGSTLADLSRELWERFRDFAMAGDRDRLLEGRRDLPQFDMTAVFEAVVNAVAHRDYSIHAAKIRLCLFSDRLELYSPGAIPNAMTVESLPYHQAARNEAITSLRAQCPIPEDDQILTDRNAMMDKRGEGVRVILDSSERLSGKHAYYRLIDESELLLVIPAASFSDVPD